jgi:hypothetical protein
MRHEIGAALATLATLLPETRDDYWVGPAPIADEKQTNVEADLVQEGIATAQRRLAAYERLTAAVLEACEVGLPVKGIESFGVPLENETEVIDRLESALQSQLPALGVGERHRFIAAVVGTITGNSNLTQKKVRDRLGYRSG